MLVGADSFGFRDGDACLHIGQCLLFTNNAGGAVALIRLPPGKHTVVQARRYPPCTP